MEKLTQIESFAKELISEYVPNFSFYYTKRKKQYGVCEHYKKRIGLSKYHALHSTESEILDTILHEIAHAIVGVGHGHNHVWKAKCIEIGANPVRCSSTTITNAGHKFEFRCANCVKIFPIYRKVREGRRTCNVCRMPVTFHTKGEDVL